MDILLSFLDMVRHVTVYEGSIIVAILGGPEIVLRIKGKDLKSSLVSIMMLLAYTISGPD